ncbi:MAG: serine hydrolase [Verrucomicrobiota bacterium]
MNISVGNRVRGWLERGAAFAIFLCAASAGAQEKLPPDNLDGPPFVTAHTWAIADGRTGKLLWGFNEDEPRKSASTTKMMCAYVVLQLAEKDPKVLDEIVTFSKLADSTPGSTADIKEGESLPVRDCLYGLLLPSGNDAGNAFAEHFNSRLAPPEGTVAEALQTRANFIAEMNRAAKRLGMTKTVYRSPYGDGGTENDRTTTARDLLRLAHAAMQNPAFRKYVGTRRYECQVKTPDGSARAAVWQNTNQLLGIEGYDGIKTGTTTQAGNCLVSSGHRGKDHLLVVVLGAESNNGRFVDSRNLYRWAWQKLGY